MLTTLKLLSSSPFVNLEGISQVSAGSSRATPKPRTMRIRSGHFFD